MLLIKGKKAKYLHVFLGMLFFLLLAGASNASAATIYSNYSTGNDTTGNGSAETPYKTFHKAYTVASSGDTINLTGTFTWTNADETGDVVTTGYTIAKNLTIQGQNAGQTIIQAATGYATGDRAVLNISAGYTVTINDLTVRYGYNRTGSNGGGINNEGTLTVNRSNISQNYVWYYPSWGGYGGGIRNAGTLYVNDSTVNNNFAQSQGGGIVNAYTASGTNTAYITNTTVAFNSTADVVATVGGAGIFLRSGTAYVTNCTVAYNVAPEGTGDTTGIDVESATLYIKNSIVAGNKVTVGGADHNVNYASGNFFDIYNWGSVVDNGGNVFGKISGFSLAASSWYDISNNGAGDNIFTLNGTATTGSLYLDSALADNGTLYGNQSLAITNASSVAVDRGLATANGSVSIPSADQRGASRNGSTDVGSYEYDGGLTVNSPTTQATNIIFSSVQYNQATIGWTNGNGSKRLVVMKQADTGTAAPVEATTYTANTVFGSGTQIGTSGWYAVYNDTGTSVTVTGLSENTAYIVQVFDYNGTTGYQKYFTDTATDNPKTQTTAVLAAPSTQATAVTYSSVASTQATIGWTIGNGSKRAVFVKQASTGTATPVNDTTYTANTVFGSGTQIGTSGWYCVYNGTGTSVAVTGLTASTSYIAQVFEYNGAAGIEKYFTDTATDNPKVQATTAAPVEATIGTGTSTTGVTEASPINIWYRSTHGQSVYTAAELNAAGIVGSTQITKVGFYVASAPVRALPNFVIRMKHTTDANVASWQTATGMTTVYSSASYLPTAGGFDSLTLSTPFTWNGTDNIVVDTSFSIVDYDQSGVVRYYSSTNGYRSARSDSSDQTNVFTGGSTSASKPQIKFTFAAAPSSYTLTYSAGANGSISGTSPQTVNSGASGSAVSAVPNAHYHFVNWSDASTANPRTDSSVAANVSVTANFAIDTYSLSYAAGAHGSISGTTSQTVNYNASGSAVTAVPEEGYHFTSWSDASTANPRTDSSVAANVSVTANFAINTYTLNYAAGTHGSLTGTTSQTVNYGGSGTAVTAVPDAGYDFAGWSDGSVANPRTDSAVAANVSVTANFSTGPIVSTLSPADNSTDVAVDSNLVMVFDRNISAAAGKNIIIKKTSDNSTVETIAANNTGKVTVSGSTATINPATTLAEGTAYYIQVEAGAFKDESNVGYVGISSASGWNFTTTITTVYVNSATGNDSTGDGTASSPFKTFTKGYAIADAGETLDLTGTFDWSDAAETGDVATTGFTISKNIIIRGHNADTTIIQAAASDNIATRRIFTIASGVNATIQNLALRYGKLTGSSADGGAIKNSGHTIISNCEIYNNRSVGAYGGAISNWDTLTITNSTIYNNTAYYMGGGIVNSYYVAADGYLTITNSTIAYNQVTAYYAYTEGGGVHFRKGSGTITNSTIAYNTACGVGGVGMDDPDGTLIIKNSIIAKNFKLNHAYCQNGQGPYDFGFRQDGYGNVTDNGNNIVGYSNRYNFTNSTDWVGPTTWAALLSWDGVFHLYNTATTGSLNLDTSLAVNSNSNKTKTLALFASSNAINNGASGSNGAVSVPTTDQRGNSRSGTLDIGAFEYNGAPADVTDPVLSGISATSTDTTATISWSTNEESSTQVKYDPSTKLSTASPLSDDVERTLGHEVQLTGLVACTKYYYEAQSQDAAGNIGASEQLNFTTKGCAGGSDISGVSEVFATRSENAELSQTVGNLKIGLVIPKEFSEDPADVQIKSLNSNAALASLNKPSSHSGIGTAVFDIKALRDPRTTISTFDSAITVTMNYSHGDIGGLDESSLVIYRHDGSNWTPLSGCSVDTEANKITCTTEHFSVFGLFGQPQESASSASSSEGGSGPNTSRGAEREKEKKVVVKKKTVTTPIMKTVLFPRDLKLGTKHDDVRRLQRYLKDYGLNVAVTGYFGAQTKTAVAQLQKNNGIKPAQGYFGIATRTIINEGKVMALNLSKVAKLEGPKQNISKSSAGLEKTSIDKTKLEQSGSLPGSSDNKEVSQKNESRKKESVSFFGKIKKWFGW